MQIRKCEYCQQEFDAMAFLKGPPRRYCSTGCRTSASRKRRLEGPGEPWRVLTGKIGMSSRYGRPEEADTYREQLRQLKADNE